MLHAVLDLIQCSIHDFLEFDILPLTIGNICCKNQARTARLYTITQCFFAESCKDDRMDRSNADNCQHEHDGFRTSWHVDSEAVTPGDSHTAQRSSNFFHIVQ